MEEEVCFAGSRTCRSQDMEEACEVGIVNPRHRARKERGGQATEEVMYLRLPCIGAIIESMEGGCVVGGVGCRSSEEIRQERLDSR